MSNDFKSMNELLGDQLAHGQRMGFKTGGHVKQGPMVTKSMDSMDHGVQPAKSDGDSQQDKEAGGTKRMKPGYAKGGSKSRHVGRMRKAGAYAKGGSTSKRKGRKKKSASAMERTKELKGRSEREMQRMGLKKGGYTSEPMVKK